jgi:rubrerythrin
VNKEGESIEMTDIETKDNSKTSISSIKHDSTYDTDVINKAVEKGSRDPNFLSHVANLLSKMQFPAFKHNILEYINKVTTDTNVIALFESLDGYIKFRDVYHVQKALEENNPEKKQTYQISSETRESPNTRTRDVTIDSSTRERESTNSNEERTDYPEVTPSAMTNFICNICGKPFQNQNDLVNHQRLERGEETHH